MYQKNKISKFIKEVCVEILLFSQVDGLVPIFIIMELCHHYGFWLTKQRLDDVCRSTWSLGLIWLKYPIEGGIVHDLHLTEGLHHMCICMIIVTQCKN